MIFVDGAGVGGGVVDMLRRHNMPVEDVQFAGRAERNDQIKYAQKRSEMWGAMRDALRYLVEWLGTRTMFYWAVPMKIKPIALALCWAERHCFASKPIPKYRD